MKIDTFILLAGLAMISFSAAMVAAQPVNDECANATEIFSGDELDASTADATGTSTSGCSVDDFYDVWYSFTPGADGFFTFSLCGSSFDTSLSLFDGCGGTLVTCNDDSLECGSRSQITCVELSGGQSYLLRVAGYNAGRGDFHLSVEECSSPENDLCANATVLPKNTGVNGSTFAATGTGLTTCSTSDLYDVWYTYTPVSDEVVSISTCGSQFDTTLSLFDACGGTQLACSEDSLNCSYLIHSYLNDLNLLGGVTYLIRVAGFESRRGYYSLALVDSTPPVVDSIVRASAGPDNGNSVFFYVYFSTPVQGFDDASDLIINANGLTYESINFAPSDDAWDVEFVGVEGIGELSIAVNTGSDVRSLSDVPLASSVTSDPILIDSVAPVLSNLSVSPAAVRAGGRVEISFDADEPLDLVEVLINGNPASAAKSLYSYDYMVTASDPVGPAVIEISAFDLAGNLTMIDDNTQLTIQQDLGLPVAAWPIATAMAFAGAWGLRRRRKG